MEQSKYVEEPQNDANNHHRVQYRLDTACHGDEAIHQPQQDTHDDQGYENLNERHSFLPFYLCCETLPRQAQELPLALSGAKNALNGFHSTNGRTTSQTSSANNVLFDILSSFWGSRCSS